MSAAVMYRRKSETVQAAQFTLPHLSPVKKVLSGLGPKLTVREPRLRSTPILWVELKSGACFRMSLGEWVVRDVDDNLRVVGQRLFVRNYEEII